MKKYRNRAVELFFEEGKTAKEAAEQVIKEFNLKDRYSSVERNIYNWTKDKGLYDECKTAGIDYDNVNHYWHKGKHFSINVKKDNEFNYDEFKQDLIEEISKWSPRYPTFRREVSYDPHCLVFDPADIHIGKICSSFETGENYNMQIAVQRVREGLHGILNKSAAFSIDKIIFIAGNDILHIDNPKRTTTSGTPQDTDGMWYDNFITAKKLLIEIIETLMTIADVHVVYNPSNHDFMSGFMLLQCVEAWFKKCNQVTFDNDMKHRKYVSYGKNLIGTTHMDGAKQQNLPLLMAHETGSSWHECKHRYIYGHHIHHKTSKDYMSVCVETLRSPSGVDGWHHRNGYQHSPKAIEGFIHHPEHGQIARLTHLF
jgi:hypothetical protein